MLAKILICYFFMEEQNLKMNMMECPERNMHVLRGKPPSIAAALKWRNCNSYVSVKYLCVFS